MAQLINVNPTRMELSKLKKRLQTAQRGHKLLKDKRDELVKQFLELVREDRTLRTEVERRLKVSYDAFSCVSAVMSPPVLEEALIYPKQSYVLELSEKNIMGVTVPSFDYKISGSSADSFPYGYAFTSSELDEAVCEISDIVPLLVELAEAEKKVMLLASEIEKTRRRVNAMEHVLIPNLQYTIKTITMRLEENERGNTTRLMKVKDMVLNQNGRY